MDWRKRIVDFFGLRRSIVALLFMAVLVGLGEKMAERFLPIYLLALGGGILSVGFLNGMDNLLSALYSFPGGYLSDRFGYKRVLIAFVNFTIFPLFLLFSHTFFMMAAAFVIRGLKEFGEPTRKALILDLAPEEQKAGMFGLYYLLRDLVVSVAAFAGGFLWQFSPTVNLLTAAACGLMGTIYFAARGRDLKGLKRGMDFPPHMG